MQFAPTTNGGLFVLGTPPSSNGTQVYYNNLATGTWTQQNGLGTTIATNSTNLYVTGAAGGIYQAVVRPPSERSSTTRYRPPIRVVRDHARSGRQHVVHQSNTNTNKVGKITPGGIITDYQAPTTNAFLGDIVSVGGTLWYADEASHLTSVTTGGTFTQHAATNPSGMTVGPDGNISSIVNGHQVDVYSTAGSLLHTYAANTTPANLQLEEIITGPDGNMWFDTFSGDNVVKMITSTGATTTYNLSGTFSGTLRGIAAGNDGNLWICDENDNKIIRVTTAGVATGSTIPTANAQPYSITNGGDGYLYFSRAGHQSNGLQDRPYLDDGRDHGVPDPDRVCRAGADHRRSEPHHLVHRRPREQDRRAVPVRQPWERGLRRGGPSWIRTMDLMLIKHAALTN